MTDLKADQCLIDWDSEGKKKITSAFIIVAEKKVSNILEEESLTLIMTYKQAILLALHAVTWMQALFARERKKRSKFIRTCKGYAQKLKRITYPQNIHSPISVT